MCSKLLSLIGAALLLTAAIVSLAHLHQPISASLKTLEHEHLVTIEDRCSFRLQSELDILRIVDCGDVQPLCSTNLSTDQMRSVRQQQCRAAQGTYAVPVALAGALSVLAAAYTVLHVFLLPSRNSKIFTTSLLTVSTVTTLVAIVALAGHMAPILHQVQLDCAYYSEEVRKTLREDGIFCATGRMPGDLPVELDGSQKLEALRNVLYGSMRVFAALIVTVCASVLTTFSVSCNKTKTDSRLSKLEDDRESRQPLIGEQGVITGITYQ
ncbi:MAG: hypothetical protein MHM6MM_005667 [Cercozoa sp. M6MM]